MARIVIIAGPTGSGKSDLALDVAEQFGGEIVNCDSLQIYRYLNIGTAKTPVEERRGIPHHLFDILNPDQVFTAGDYIRVARPVLREIADRGRMPVVAGGTGFYLRALLQGLFSGPSRDDQLRRRLAARKPGSLHRLLQRFDPESAARIHPNDAQKLVRALEVCLLARRPLTDLHGEAPEPLQGFRLLKIGLEPPRDLLYARINDRCVRMFQAGLLDEVRAVLAMGFGQDSKALESIGYREALLHLQGKIPLDEAIALAQRNTRRYAKRQWTWFRRESSLQWIAGFGNLLQTRETAFRLVEQDKNFLKFLRNGLPDSP